MFKRAASRAIAVAFAWLAASIGARADIAAMWDGATANWTAAVHWNTNPAFPNNNGPVFFDTTINAGTASLDQNITINQLVLGGGAIDGAFALTVLEGLQWTGGAIRGGGTLVVGSAAPSTIAGGAQPLVLEARRIDNSGALTFATGTIRGGSAATINNLVGATFTMLDDSSFFADAANPSYSFNNAGTFIDRATSGVGFTTMDAVFNNTGTVRVERTGGTSQTFSLAGGGTHSGSFDLKAGTALELGGSTTLEGGVSFTGDGVLIVAGNVLMAGSVSGRNLAVAVGELNLAGSTIGLSGEARQTGGIVRMNGGTLRVAGGLGALVIDDGAITGTGTLDARLDVQGNIAPGSGLGTLAVTGATNFGEDARLTIEIGGASAGSFDLLAIASSATLGGTLSVSFANGFVPAPEGSFTILTSGVGVSGVFANAPIDGGRFPTADGAGSFVIDYTSTSVVLRQYVPEPSPAILTVLSGALLVGRSRKRWLVRLT
jgi:hypothetical protein